ncbi:hypothetical protein MY04_4998 [Flammeovirga sp. MY04]|uniref:hypothetical protein n=1 Tax=Flammeovirga sp. MY04 TaxID=1191459 RepID=UPI0008062417|nr:hypothetical protein [Flammeovirga sp. MY04]ANQ52333.1 hypothetical protein MY04_4998 [Flammeovirga sp. MY04]
MKNLYFPAILTLLFSFEVFAFDTEWYNKYISIIDVELNDTQTKDLLTEWVGIYEDNSTIYLYNLSTEQFFCSFENGIRSATIKEVTKTSGVVNVRLVVNDNALIYVTFNRANGKVITCKAEHI